MQGPLESSSVATEARRIKDLRECPQCGMICRMPATPAGHVVDCPQCNHPLWRKQVHPFKYVIACVLSAALFYSFAIVAPFLEISAHGRFQLAKLETGPDQLMSGGFEMVGFLVLAVTIIFPGVKIAILLLTLIGVETKSLPAPFMKAIFRWYEPIRPWAMIDVYLLGFLVAYTRLVALASVHLDTALFALVGVMLSMSAADAALDKESVWQALDKVDHKPASPALALTAQSEAPAGRRPFLIGCHCCDLVNLASPGAGCTRCGTTLHVRKPGSINRSLCLLIAAAMLYIPANVYPVMLITSLGSSQPFTIFAGIMELIHAGLWPLALLVFFASITIPLMKLILLAYMLWQTQRRKRAHLLAKTRVYRVVEFVGRWSMIDVFMISILVALVRFGQLTNIEASTGAPCFAAVVVLTMFAVHFFDPRLMWDRPARRSNTRTKHLKSQLGPA
jgi:paraquat-inducible protein A